jgi:tetratricopeptide (TPR) repeat protein
MALALAAQDEPREAAEIAEQALALGPPERFLPGLHAVAGTRAAVVREWQRAAGHFRQALAGGQAGRLSPEQLLLAAESLVRARDAAAAREALAAFALRSDSSAEERERGKLWLLEALLLVDDAAVLMPEPASAGPLRASIELRRGLLTEMRGNREEAWAMYSSISWNDSNVLPLWERAILDERLRVAARLTR